MGGMKPGLGARLCPRCGTRVDERRGKFSPYCLSCGQPLNNDRQSMTTYAGAAPQKASSALPWVIGILCFSCLLVGIGIAIFLVRSSSAPEDDEGTAAASPSASPAVPSVERVEGPPSSKSGTASKPP